MIDVMTAVSQAAETGIVLADNFPDPGTGEAPPGADGFTLMLRWVFWLGLVVCVGGLIGAGAYMAVSFSRGEGGEHLGRVVKVGAGAVLIGAGSAIISALVEAGSNSGGV